jgi:lambda family phage portal protein
MAKAPGKFLSGLRRFLGLDRPKYQRPLRPKAYERPRRPKAYLSNPERDRLRRGETELEDAMEVASGPMYGSLLSDVQHTRRGQVRARFDTAQTTDDNRKHWAMADGLAADAAANPNIRYILRNRSRYEVNNNSYARGMIETVANDIIGTGPRLQVTTADEKLNDQVEAAFAAWFRATGMADKLRTMVKAKKQDGEAFGCLITNENLPNPVKLDVMLKEADCVRFVDINLLLVPSVDGIRYDEFGNPVEYYVLRVHPGYWAYASGYIGLPWEYDKWDAANVVHWFRVDRPGQHRGLPEILPALPLFAQLRRYTLATLDAAETAADHAIVMETNANANVEPDSVEPMDVLALERRMMTTLPEGWHAGQIKPEHPATTYPQFKREIITEIARSLNMPFNVAAGDSSGYNYASGRLDHQSYFKQIRIEQAQCEAVVLDRIFSAWLSEAILISGLLPIQVRTMKALPHTWHWDGHEHVDPAKEANAQQTRLSTGTTTYADEFAKVGKDHVKAFESQAAALGLTVDEYRQKLVNKLFGGGALAAQPTAPDDEDAVTTPAHTEDDRPSADDGEDI